MGGGMTCSPCPPGFCILRSETLMRLATKTEALGKERVCQKGEGGEGKEGRGGCLGRR